MRTSYVLVAALLSACGGDETKPTKVVVAGSDAGTSQSYEHDAGRPNVDSGVAGRGGSGGASVEVDSGKQLPTGGMAAGGSGGKAGTNPPPEGGTGGEAEQPMGGSPAPVEHVLWSQEWNVEVHTATGYGAAAGDTMGLVLDAGQGCRFGLEGAASGSTQTYETDGKCIGTFSAPQGFAAFFSADGKTGGSAGRMDLVGWKEAVTGHTVKSLRRTQTYTIQLLGSGTMRWDYADYSGKFEAIGF